jgi:CBS domain containing-hemolysin-like protein
MSPVLIVEIVGVIVFLACSGFFSSTESAFFSLNPLDVRRIGQRNAARGKWVHDILSSPTRLLSSVLIGNTIVNTLVSAVGYSLAESLVPHHGQEIAVGAMTVLLLIFGEIGPKRLGLLYAQPLAALYVPAVRVLLVVATPLRVGMDALMRRFESFFRPRGRTLSEAEFETVVDIGGEEGILKDEELGMIKAIIRLDRMKASDIMTPRVDLIGVDVEDDPAEALKRALMAKLNYLLVHRGGLDNVEALLDVRKYLLDPERRMAAARMTPMFVPEAMPLTRLLTQFQKEKKRLAVVVDEYGGTAGIVTRGDVLEEISGEVYEEMSKPRPLFQQAGPHRWIVDPQFRLADLNRKLRLHLEAEDAERLSGWITYHAGKLPQANDVIEAQGCRVTVLEAKRHRVTLAQMEPLENEA